jgi:hypothetical protein
VQLLLLIMDMPLNLTSPVQMDILMRAMDTP